MTVKVFLEDVVMEWDGMGWGDGRQRDWESGSGVDQAGSWCSSGFAWW